MLQNIVFHVNHILHFNVAWLTLNTWLAFKRSIYLSQECYNNSSAWLDCSADTKTFWERKKLFSCTNTSQQSKSVVLDVLGLHRIYFNLYRISCIYHVTKSNKTWLICNTIMYDYVLWGKIFFSHVGSHRKSLEAYFTFRGFPTRLFPVQATTPCLVKYATVFCFCDFGSWSCTAIVDSSLLFFTCLGPRGQHSLAKSWGCPLIPIEFFFSS